MIEFTLILSFLNVIQRLVQKTAVKPTYKEEIEKDWRLILHDDPVHTIQQVVEIINTSCPLCTGPRAYEVTLEVHMTGAGSFHPQVNI